MENLLPNEELYNEFKRLQAENFHLKNQLSNKNKQIRGRDKQIQQMAKQLKEFKGQKQHYKNGKRGTNFNG
jgi:regulator of replication initiation timing